MTSARWLIPLTLAAPAHAEDLRLRGIIRDFSQSHIDMENEHGVDPGIVRRRLGDDGLPVYGNHERTVTTHGRAAFDQWYRDVPGVNQRAPLVLTLSNTPAEPNVYRFTDLAFFPIDGQLGGNEGNEHNFHFTLEMHTQFVYEGGEQLTFEGDDDLWVFVNGYRVIDLGGVHGALTETADFDAVAAQAGLVRGETYPLDIFFAERARTESHFTLSTTARPFEDDGPGGNPGGDPGGGPGGTPGDPDRPPEIDDCLDDPACVIPCNNGECPLDLICVDEQCVDPCADVACPVDQICVAGACVGIPDGGVVDGGIGQFAPPPPLPDMGGASADSAGDGGCQVGWPGAPAPTGWALLGALFGWRLRRRRVQA